MSDSSRITEYISDSVNELTNSKVERKFIIDLCNLIKYRCKGIKSNEEYYEKMKPLSEFLSLPLETNFNIEKYSYKFFYIFLQLFSLKYIGYSERRYEEYLCDYSIIDPIWMQIQFSLPLEGRVTLSYFLFRYLFDGEKYPMTYFFLDYHVVVNKTVRDYGSNFKFQHYKSQELPVNYYLFDRIISRYFWNALKKHMDIDRYSSWYALDNFNVIKTDLYTATRESYYNCRDKALKECIPLCDNIYEIISLKSLYLNGEEPLLRSDKEIEEILARSITDQDKYDAASSSYEICKIMKKYPVFASSFESLEDIPAMIWISAYKVYKKAKGNKFSPIINKLFTAHGKPSITIMGLINRKKTLPFERNIIFNLILLQYSSLFKEMNYEECLNFIVSLYSKAQDLTCRVDEYSEKMYVLLHALLRSIFASAVVHIHSCYKAGSFYDIPPEERMDAKMIIDIFEKNVEDAILKAKHSSNNDVTL